MGASDRCCLAKTRRVDRGHLGPGPAPPGDRFGSLSSVGADLQHSPMTVINSRFFNGSSVGEEFKYSGTISDSGFVSLVGPPPVQKAGAMEGRVSLERALLIQLCQK